MQRIRLTRLASALATLPMVTLGAEAIAAQVTVNPEKDNTIYQGADATENFEDNSCGAGSNTFSGVTNDGFLRRSLMQFDIAGAIPAGSTIDRVVLTLDVNRSGDNQDSIMALHPIGTVWGEGTVNCDSDRGGGAGAPAQNGDATWLDAEFNVTPWGTAGGDFGAESGDALVPTRGDAIWDSADIGNETMVADVQAWLDEPANNFGWIVIGEESQSSTTRRFASREGTPAPTLDIEFTPSGEVYACCFADGGCSVQDTTSCADQGGTSDTGTSSCSPNPCPQPTGACCNPDESCSDGVAKATCESVGGFFNGADSLCSDNGVDCGLDPFVDPLPLPGVLQPIGTRSDGVLQYEVTMSEVGQVLHRDLPTTDVWTYNGSFPGPTIEATSGLPIEVKYINDLPTTGQRRGGHYLEVDECAHGPSYWRDAPRTVVHLHGGHVPSRVDGQPEFDFMPGEFDTYEYPNDQDPATLWYHDHALGITRLNVYMGMAAYYLIRDSFEDGLGLPAGEFEVPLVVQDREFNPDGTFFYPPTLQDAFFGDKILVNGKVWPYFNVKQGKYRFRFLNGSQARTYRLRLENLDDPAEIIPFTLIGTDLGLISAPNALNDFVMSPAERFDVVVDFSAFPAGTEIVLRNDQNATPNVPNVMKFIVQGQAGHTAPLPGTLRTVDPIPESEAVVTRRFELERVAEPCAGGEWVIRSFDEQGNVTGEHWDDISEFPVLGSTEIWEFVNLSNTMHPMHIHLVKFQVLDRNGNPNLAPWEDNTWKDTVRVPPNGSVRVIMRFEDYPGRFPYHCHILDHEDHEMMRQFQATNDPALCDGDGTCDANEDCVSCSDCGMVSGAFCGNGLCEIGDGEDCVSCPEDCAGKQKGANQFCCGDGDGNGAVPNCGKAADGFTVLDDRCTTGSFYCRIMPRVAACCGDALCEGQEDESVCAVDCATSGGGSCESITSKDECIATAGCAWSGSPKSGSCGASGGGGCTPTEDPETSCGDGVDNDCDGLIDGDDPDCAGPPADCSQYNDADSCRADAACRWSKKDGACV